MGVRFLILLTVFISGCATPYAEVGVAYPLDKYTDYWVQTDRTWQCSNGPQAHFEVGVEKNDWQLGIHHQSWWGCGGPFNNRPEVYENDIRITKKWGGE